MDTKQLRIHLRMLDAALEHAALLAELGREASEGTPDTFLFDAAHKAIRDFRDSYPAIAELWHEPMRLDIAKTEAAVQSGEAEPPRPEQKGAKKGGRIPCTMCEQFFPSVIALQAHKCAMRSDPVPPGRTLVRTTDGFVHCPMCRNSFITLSAAQKHQCIPK